MHKTLFCAIPAGRIGGVRGLTAFFTGVVISAGVATFSPGPSRCVALPRQDWAILPAG